MSTLQMFTGIYRVSTGKSKCGDFKFMGIACIPAIPVILKSPDFHCKGQIISECPYEIIVYPKIATKKFPRFLP